MESTSYSNNLPPATPQKCILEGLDGEVEKA